MTDEEWRAYFRQYKACLDLPAILFYKDLMRVFPQAIFVLTVRDPESWFKSWRDSIAQSLQLIQHPLYKHVLDLDKKVGTVRSPYITAL